MTRVDCDDCSENFQTKKLYIKHLKSRKCSQSRVRGQAQSDAKKSRDENVPSPVGGSSSSAPGSPQVQTTRNMEALQAQISTLTPQQKAELQAQITEKQKQVLQAIPYNQLSEKQKEILKRLTSPKQSSPSPQLGSKAAASVQGGASGGMAPSRVVKLSLKPGHSQQQAGQQVPASVAPATPLYTYSGSMGRGKAGGSPANTPQQRVTVTHSKTTSNIVNKTASNAKVVTTTSTTTRVTPNSRILSGTSISRSRVSAVQAPPEPEPELITEFEFGDDNIVDVESDDEGPERNPLGEVEDSNPLETDSLPSTLGKLEGIRVKKIGKSLVGVDNVVVQVATQKENCPVCKKYFSKSSLPAHIESRHKVECPKCPLTFYPAEIEGHKVSAHQPVKEKCNICDIMIIQEEMVKHVDQVHRVDCSKCKEKVLKHKFKEHIRNIHETYLCNECNARYESDDLLKSHKLEIHPKEKCPECNQLFGLQAQVDAHVLEVHPKEYCDEEDCEASFKTTEDLLKHKDKQHPKIMKFNGGMFMMMTVEDNEESEGEEESEPEDQMELEAESSPADDAESSSLEDNISKSNPESEEKRPNSGTFLMRLMVTEPEVGVVELDHKKEVMMNTIKRCLDRVYEEVFSRVF